MEHHGPENAIAETLDEQAREAAARVEAWRLKLLLDAGFPTELADELARRRDVDVHQAVELVNRGCDPDTAARIVS